jgi:hypothetical protein
MLFKLFFEASATIAETGIVSDTAQNDLYVSRNWRCPAVLAMYVPGGTYPYSTAYSKKREGGQEGKSERQEDRGILGTAKGSATLNTKYDIFVRLKMLCAQCSAFLLPWFGFRDPLVTLALLFPLPLSLSVLI